MADRMLFCTLDRQRYFLVPQGVRLQAGALQVQSFARQQQEVSEDIGWYEVDAAEARRWVNERFSSSLTRAGDVLVGILGQLRAASKQHGRASATGALSPRAQPQRCRHGRSRVSAPVTRAHGQPIPAVVAF